MSKEKTGKEKTVLPTEDLSLRNISHSYRRKLEGIGSISAERLSWQARVDTEKVMRIKGLGESYAELLECAGVDNLEELSRRDADRLYDKLMEVNLLKKLVRKSPNRKQVKDWISQAKKLLKTIQY